MTLLSVEDLSVQFGHRSEPVTVVNRITFRIEPGEVLGLVGESGSGKSVTSRAVLRMIKQPGRISSGSVSFDGRDVLGMSNGNLRRFRATEVGMVFQDPFSALNPVVRVGSQLIETLRLNVGLGRKPARERAVELLESVGIPDPERNFAAYPHQLSGGMRQRVMIALATAANPRLLLADEPTTALDVTTQQQILKLLATMQRDLGMAMLLVSHDFGVISQMCDRVLVMYGGTIVESGSVHDIYNDPRHPYTKALLATVPKLEVPEGDDRHRWALPGQPPDPRSRPTGCVFAPRCEFVMDDCLDTAVELRPVDVRRYSACLFDSPGRDKQTHLGPVAIGGGLVD
ncbi:Dipeptide transport ATP-binding protein DppD [Mycolicibacterium vanbaalenii]|uniref:Dipeptide transport ATP-binding protein DppD n=1 Tax=Mycolicibacterium vanbaalenii TaxID=110539 RepID=A0A5S9QEV4_MYCVN|nr:Dipeptide transport ATP-binding protein DppD [Mycolicibacterium vanbaalenii]